MSAASTRSETGHSCCRKRAGLVRFLARHPAFRRGVAALCRSRPADLLAGWLARFVLHRYQAVDYQALLESHTCGSDSASSPGLPNADCQFAGGIVDRPGARAKLARLLAGLEELDPRIRCGLLKTWFHTGAVASILREAESLTPSEDGTQRVQPIDALVAPFGRCNLHCRGCYAAQELGQPSATIQQLDDVIDQLVRLNAYHVLLVGKGEPFYDDASRECLFEAVRRHPQVFFSVFTNGTSILPWDIRQLKRCPHLIPVLSLDGTEEINDWRRGADVYRCVVAACQRLREAGLLFGYIATVFNQNYEVVLNPAFVGRMMDLGCRVGYYSLFITPEVATGNTAGDCRDMMLNPQRREEYFQRFGELDAAVAIPLIDVDGIEAHFGCRAKRGATVYVDAVTGRVSPCIRAPLAADGCNIYQAAGRNRLAEILDSEPFRRYRQEHPAVPICEAFARCREPGPAEVIS